MKSGSQHALSPGFDLQNCIDWTGRPMPVIPALGRKKQEEQKFKVIFSYINDSPSA